MSPRAAATGKPARVASLRLRWYRAFAVLTAVVVLAGVGNFVGTRLLVQTFRHSAVRAEREATNNVELRADLVIHAILISSPITGDQELRVEAIQSKIRAGFAEAVDNEEDPKAKGLLRWSLREWEGIVEAARPQGRPAGPIAQGEALPAAASRVLALLDRAGSSSRTAVRLDLARAASLDRKIMTVLAVIKLLAIVLAVRLARRLSTQILRPVSVLQEAANHLAAGDLDHRIKVDRNDELGQLAVSFNAMADAVASSQRTLALEAKSDSLTGLVNRAGFRSRLEAALAIPERRNGDQAVLFVDLDDFKDRVLDPLDGELEVDGAHDALAELLVDESLDRRPVHLRDLVEAVEERVHRHGAVERAPDRMRRCSDPAIAFSRLPCLGRTPVIRRARSFPSDFRP